MKIVALNSLSNKNISVILDHIFKLNRYVRQKTHSSMSSGFGKRNWFRRCFVVDDDRSCVCQFFENICRKNVDNLEVTKIRILSLSLSHCYRALIYEILANFQWISYLVFRSILCSDLRNLSNTASIAPFRSHRTSLCLFSGMRDKDIPCPYIADFFVDIQPGDRFLNSKIKYGYGWIAR